MPNKERVQIGVMGSMADIELRSTEMETASELGKLIAQNGFTLIFGFEGDFNSFSTQAAVAAEAEGGRTIAFLWGKRGADLGELKSARIETGQQRGGGREFSLVYSCDGIVCIGGGSGTLTEIAIAYQAGIPVVTLIGTGGWSDKLANDYLDDRKRAIIHGAKDAYEAMEILRRNIDILK